MVSEIILRKVINWIEIADEDLQFAQHGLTIPKKPPFRLIAYHAQQCAEKYLKAFLVYKNQDFPYTHNLTILLEYCSKHRNWTEQIMNTEELSSYAITSRYPNEDKEVTKDDAVRAIFLAGTVRNVVREALKKEDLDL